MKILVADDNEPLRLFYEYELREEGYDVVTAKNGEEALLQLEEEKPDLVVLDIVMPVMDGIETIGRIVKNGKKIPVIMNTSFAETQDNYENCGADACLTKSADLKELKEKIRELLDRDRFTSPERAPSP